MVHKKIPVLIILALAAGGPFGAAQEKRRLGLEEAVRLALETSHAMHGSEMRREAAAAKVRETDAARLPALRFGGGYARLSEVPPFEVTLPFPPLSSLPTKFVVSPNYYNSFTLRLSLQQPLFTGFRLQSAAAMTRELERAATHDTAGDRADLVYGVTAAYWNMVKALEVRAVLGENVSRLQAHLRDVENFREQGLLTMNEVLRVKTQLANAELMDLEAQNAVQLATVGLNSLTGLPLEAGLEPTTPVEAAASEAAALESADLQSLVQRAKESRPELRALGARVRASDAGVTAAKSGWLPQAFISGNYYHLRPNPRVMPARDEFYGTWDLGVTVSFDVWNWGQTRQQVSQAEAQRAQARDGLSLMEDQVVLEVTQAFLGLRQAGQRIAAAESAVGQAEENLRVTTDRFREGVALSRDV
ncbi:MAG: TolC family protein, partial [Candidatus Aminicenantes bacterium]|nr:TolC family protein [Candidatus Aminicenantes bacterium]